MGEKDDKICRKEKLLLEIRDLRMKITERRFKIHDMTYTTNKMFSRILKLQRPTRVRRQQMKRRKYDPSNSMTGDLYNALPSQSYAARENVSDEGIFSADNS